MPKLEGDSLLRLHSYCPSCAAVKMFSVAAGHSTARFRCCRCNWQESYEFWDKVREAIQKFDRSQYRGEYRKMNNA